MSTKLSPKQVRFCEEYLIDLNATRAYKAAYPACHSDNTARTNGSKLLASTNISTRIEELKSARSSRTEITADYVLTGLKEVAERCLQRVPVMEFNYEEKQMEQKKDDEGNGVWEFDSSGANRAFELLGKHVGIFEKDNKQKATKAQFFKIGDQLIEM